MDFNTQDLIQKLIKLQNQMSEIDAALKNVRAETHNALWDLVKATRNSKTATAR
jgi:hypothetical protein